MGKRTKNLAAIGVLTALYFIAGKLGLSIAFVHPSSMPVWAPAGIALAAFLIFGYQVWPGVFLGSFLVNITTVASVPRSVGIATGNTLGGLLGAYLVCRFAHGRKAFNNAGDVLKFAVLAGLLSTTVSATLGVTSLMVGNLAGWANYKPIWLTWWLGDGVGNLLVTPFLILWSSDHRVHWKWSRWAEVEILLICLVLVGQIVFCGLFLSGRSDYPIEYLSIPFLVWAAFRFGQREAATATLLLSGIATWGTLHGFGPFERESQITSLLLLQAFIGIMAILTLALAAEVTEHNRADERVRQMVSTDPLTGLVNYRRLIEILESEIRRCGRTERSFGVLLLDLDGLKKINDTHGHLVGSRALCRLANILRIQCREIDTAARYGGDEFVLILPETDSEAARRVVERISERLRNDREDPFISASTGVAVFPQDGRTASELLGAADLALYREKGSSKSKFRVAGTT